MKIRHLIAGILFTIGLIITFGSVGGLETHSIGELQFWLMSIGGLSMMGLAIPISGDTKRED